MPLPAREKISGIPRFKKFLFLVFIILLLIITTEASYYFLVLKNRQEGELTGVQQTDLALKKGKIELNTISGDIARVEEDKLAIRLDDNSERAFLVKGGSKFVVFKGTAEEGGESEGYIFDGSNLQDFLSAGDNLLRAFSSGSEIFSDYDSGTMRESMPILIEKE